MGRGPCASPTGGKAAMPQTLLLALVRDSVLAPSHNRHGGAGRWRPSAVLMPGATLICHMLSAQQGDTFGPLIGYLRL